MILFPYKFDSESYRVPFLTIAVCIVCILVFLHQLSSERRFAKSVDAFCTSGISINQATIVKHINDDRVDGDCRFAFQTIHGSSDPDQTIRELAAKSAEPRFYDDPGADQRYKAQVLGAAYASFLAAVPVDVTESMEDRPGQFDLRRMIVSCFAHLGWEHLIFNLVFFYAFATCIEYVLGPVHFACCFLLMAFGGSWAYHLSVASGDGLPSIGLSGVVMGMMALLGVLVPRAQVWMFFWFGIWIRTFTAPALLLAGFYVAGDIVALKAGDMDVNHAAHVGGAATGAVLGIIYRIFARGRLAQAKAEIR